jgi:hypothetical protein
MAPGQCTILLLLQEVYNAIALRFIPVYCEINYTHTVQTPRTA